MYQEYHADESSNLQCQMIDNAHHKTSSNPTP